ncbi:HNH endonuclease [Staphylococcus epidermidis]|uniref:HNH endonuclease n=1 Tax=Staphylococcus epidermidis TaxID=1282 RepID=UPI00066B46D6|nr:HNH endonuclease [Staphylococcus epidermidis]MDU1612806.1 HNH endonuclease [Staphylococcus epidermidis]MDU1712656.1 HNH endonuclease [Staphylococcus epidermidis]MDU1766172.1 HNH endonuclease [Staphylococcus epidermidis]MDU7376634.1 HNH endonuclease [Staphylococcus epidermidis]
MSKPKWNSAKKRKIKNELTQGIYKCVMCSNIFDSVDYLQIEHKIPVSKGGTNELSNLTVLCKSCNSSRKNRTGNEHLKIILKNIEKEMDKINIDLLAYEKEIGALDNGDIAEIIGQLEDMYTDFHNTLVGEVLDA